MYGKPILIPQFERMTRHYPLKDTRADHPGKTKRRGVCIYYHPKIFVMQISSIVLSVCLVGEIPIGEKKDYVITLYRSPSQNQDGF